MSPLRRAALLLLVVVAACARPGAPSGGPEDVVPPVLLSVSPGSLAVDVPVDAPLVLEFTEPVDVGDLDRILWIHPRRVPRKANTDDNRVEILFREPWPDSTTVSVLVTTALRDKRRNPLGAPYRWVFSTGDSVDPGVVRGSVEGSARGRDATVLVALYPVTGDTLPDPDTVDPVALTQAGEEGAFLLEGLPADGELHLLLAMVDRDGNRRIRGANEFYSARPESVRLTPESPSLEVPLRLIDPDAPGVLEGRLLRAEADTIPVGIEVFAADDDSLRLAVERAVADTAGAFEMPRVPPGTYRVAVYCDANANGIRDARESLRVVWSGIVLAPGETLALGEREGPDCAAAARRE